VNAQEVVEPERASIDTIKNLHRVYVICEDDDIRTTIVSMLSGYSGLEVVSSPKDAEFYLEMRDLTRDVAATPFGLLARENAPQVQRTPAMGLLEVRRDGER
jgi:hypothetical protein